MSSAHDLPSTISPEAVPEGPHLALVPPLVDDVLPAFDFDRALADASPRLQRYATRRLGSAHEAEEVVQEALLRAYQHRSAFATVDDLMAWSTVVTGRLVIDRVRVRARSVSVSEVPEGDRLGRDTAEVVVARAEARLALDALESMPTRQAAVLWAREVEGQSYDEIAERYGLSEPTVRSLLHRARKALRREYAARGGTLPVGGLVLLAPWLHSLRGLSRLRDAVRRATVSGAALSIAGLSAITAIGLSPAAPSNQPPAVGTQGAPVVQMPSSSPAVVSVQTRSKIDPVATAPAAREGDPHGNLNVEEACLPTSLSGNSRGTGACGETRSPTVPVLYIGPQLPDNPSGVHRIGVSSSDADCSKVPTTPVTECRYEPTPQP